MSPAYVCAACGQGMTGDEAALNYKYVSRRTETFLCPVCLGKRLGVGPEELHVMIRKFRLQGCRLFTPLAPGEEELLLRELGTVKD